jgi:hypothetical protein
MGELAKLQAQNKERSGHCTRAKQYERRADEYDDHPAYELGDNKHIVMRGGAYVTRNERHDTALPVVNHGVLDWSYCRNAVEYPLHDKSRLARERHRHIARCDMSSCGRGARDNGAYSIYVLVGRKHRGCTSSNNTDGAVVPVHRQQ